MTSQILPNPLFPDPIQCPSELIYLNPYNFGTKREIEKR